MLAAIRKFAKSWVALLLFVPLLISFAIFGIPDVMKRAQKDAVIVAGSRTLTTADFKQEFDNFRKRAEQQAGQKLTPEIIAENGLDRTVLEGVANQQALGEFLHKLGIQPSDKLIVAEIQKQPVFFDQITGRFDKTHYERLLAENGLSPTKFEQQMRDQMAEAHFATALVNGLRAPRAYAGLEALYGLESRDVAYFIVPVNSVPLPVKPTDAQLTQFLKENAAQLTRPEFRILTVVRFNPSQVAAGLPIDPKELEQRYQFRKDTLSRPETRTLVQVPAKDAAAAKRIADRLVKGEDPAVVAKAEGVDAITYTDKPKTAIADRKVAEAAFAMGANQVSQPIKGDLGLAIVRVESVTPGRTVTLEEIRPQLEAELRKDAAAEKVYALTQAYDDAHASGSDLVESAKKAGVAAMTIGPVSEQGGDPQGQPVAGVDAKLISAAFALPPGGESELQDGSEASYFAVRVDKIIPSALPPLEEVRDVLTAEWMRRDLVKRLQAKADEYAARVKKGESLEAVAAAAGSPVVKVPGMTRVTAGQIQTLPREAIYKAFGAKPGDIFTADGAPRGILVAKLEAARVGAGPNLGRLTEQSRQQMSMAMFQSIAESARAGARAELKVKTNRNLARSAIGLEPLPDPKAKTTGKAAEKAK
jgi:peptidyl-prolyl cis-trans isomerase D